MRHCKYYPGIDEDDTDIPDDLNETDFDGDGYD